MGGVHLNHELPVAELADESRVFSFSYSRHEDGPEVAHDSHEIDVLGLARNQVRLLAGGAPAVNVHVAVTVLDAEGKLTCIWFQNDIAMSVFVVCGQLRVDPVRRTQMVEVASDRFDVGAPDEAGRQGFPS